MTDPQREAEQAVDLLEEHHGWMMPDTEYQIELYHESGEEPEYGEHGFQVSYRLEARLPAENPSQRDSEFEFRGGHLMFGNVDEIQDQYKALIDEFRERFDYSSLEYENWEDLEEQLRGENL